MPKFDPAKQHRRSIRLQSYDYAEAGAYYLTICVHRRQCLLGEINQSTVMLSSSGEVALNIWQRLPQKYPLVELDAFVIMPNHVHGIVVINEVNPAAPLGELVRYFKSCSSRIINQLNGSQGSAFWQRDYYERIIRTEGELAALRTYIENNPANWFTDESYITP
jgi:REP element-mobilizing transposase RayT